METFTPNEIRDQAQLWFETHAGTYSRLLKRTKAEGKRAFVVFCDLMLGVDYRDIKGQNKVAFIDSFMTSSINSRITAQQLVAGSVEYKELVEKMKLEFSNVSLVKFHKYQNLVKIK